MKNILFMALATVFVLASSCKKEESKAVEASEAEEVKKEVAAAEGSFKVDESQSSIMWEGSKATGSKHNGAIQIKTGALSVEDGNIQSGRFVIDMTSMTNEDLPEAKKGDLIGHLQSEDFFHVEKFPVAHFAVTDSRQIANSQSGNTHQITGNLTMRGKTNSITIPAKVELKGDMVKASTPEFAINRTDWDIKYGSGVIGTVKDKMINDDIVLKINLVAKK